MNGKFANARELRDPMILPKELRSIAERYRAGMSAEVIDILEHAAEELEGWFKVYKSLHSDRK